VAKRSPILGYNHNVRYRGLIFHVQTEDSGLLSPHLFTHMFHGGVILSTRKLVYDSGSAEEAIKALMQAQHKAVLKDLKKGSFDDKIDEYLGATPGLLPRGSTEPGAEPGRDSEPVLPSPSLRSQTEHDIIPEELLDLGSEPHAVPVFPPERPSATVNRVPPPVPAAARKTTPVAVPRTQTAERGSAASQPLLRPPPPAEGRDSPTLSDLGSVAAAIDAANNTVRTVVPHHPDSQPEILIQLELDDSDDELHASRTRSARDTETNDRDARTATISDGVPGSLGSARPGESMPPQPAPPERRTGDRGSAVGAASLPPARPITRPPSRPAFTPQAVMSRPLTPDEGRSSRESDAVEVYAPAPPTAEAPPGVATERPGQYAQHKRVSQKIPMDVIKGERDRTGSIPVPSGLARPGRTSAVPSTNPPTGPIPRQITKEPTPSSAVPPPVPAARASELARPPAQGPRPTERPRTPTPSRLSPSGPTSSRTATGSSGGVVMTRPAVIVGAPAKPAVPPRVRKAREEEGRGFGQGLISEKSLDEVILAYLSEDADEK
jgi:hypothetical protein